MLEAWLPYCTSSALNRHFPLEALRSIDQALLKLSRRPDGYLVRSHYRSFRQRTRQLYEELLNHWDPSTAADIVILLSDIQHSYEPPAMSTTQQLP